MFIPVKIKSLFSAVASIIFLMMALSFVSVVSVSAQKVPSAPNPNLDQCANGGAPAPRQPCTGANWQNGNLNGQQAQYIEGESVPYRIIFSGTPNTSSAILLEWDTTKGGKHALDYLTTYNRTEVIGNDPCNGVAGCNLSTFTTFPVPVDPDVTAGFDQVSGNSDDITQVAGVFTLFGGTIDGVSGYSLSGSYAGDSTRSITVNLTFGPTGTVVLAWGGHIARRADWGVNNSAIAISGSPYHMRISGQDRSLKIDAVIFPGSVTIIKRVNNLDGTFSSPFTFAFTSSANFGVTNFSLTDSDPTQLGGGSRTNSNILLFGSANAITVTEQPIPGGAYSLGDLSCQEQAGGIPNVQNTTVNFATASANIIVEEGEFVTCTFTNTQFLPSAGTTSISGRVLTSEGYGIRNATVVVTDSEGNIKTAISSPFGYYTVSDIEVGRAYVVTVKSKQGVFTPRFFTLEDAMYNVDFISGQ